MHSVVLAHRHRWLWEGVAAASHGQAKGGRTERLRAAAAFAAVANDAVAAFASAAYAGASALRRRNCLRVI